MNECVIFVWLRASRVLFLDVFAHKNFKHKIFSNFFMILLIDQILSLLLKTPILKTRLSNVKTLKIKMAHLAKILKAVALLKSIQKEHK